MSFVLVTGGIGYIGSHTVVELLQNGYNVIIIDNLSNSSIEVLNRITEIVDFETIVIHHEYQARYSADKSNKLYFYKIDLEHESDKLPELFQKYHISAVMHFAGLKAVGESVKLPLKYYRNNLISTMNLLDIMNQYECYRFIFSSSATVYGTNPAPVHEDMPIGVGISNPYGQTKYMIELILRDLAISACNKNSNNISKNWKIIALRYFNPVGGHPSGLLYEDPTGIPNNLMPYLVKWRIRHRVILY